ncbi:MAG: hypothetical protein Q9184_001409 [Pyrenodesmia sp. 2 TL-2023]
MDIRYSGLVDPSDYRMDDLEGHCDVRRCTSARAPEQNGAIRAQKDWSKLVQPLDEYKGGRRKGNVENDTMLEALRQGAEEGAILDPNTGKQQNPDANTPQNDDTGL